MQAVHPDALRLLDQIRAAGSPTYESLPPAEARLAHAARGRALQSEPDPMAGIREMEARDGEFRVPVRLYRPAAAAPGALMPCLLFLHGGGWVLGSLETHDWVCRRLARESGGCVLSVDYRLAPEHPFPAAVDDALAALRWLAREAGALGIDPARIALGGDSAGGNLAAVLALMGRDGMAPPSIFQALLYPAVDLDVVEGGYGPRTPGMVLTAETMHYFIGHYLPDPAMRSDWRASPLRAPSLRDTPPALVLTCGHDPLAREGRLYAERLKREGVRVTALHVSDLPHAVLTMDKAIGPAAALLNFVAAMLRDAWR
ncbi:alpha/beta hydrolase [Roseomonas chloroacetimidivorans]|jgi:acetyl esterase|uniref:alpha/beta hydrolase n=1 Tax=Roseomonas chloroacetimidivorans TaxID=1766656 RepID=UPI003C72BCB8